MSPDNCSVQFKFILAVKCLCVMLLMNEFHICCGRACAPVATLMMMMVLRCNLHETIMNVGLQVHCIKGYRCTVHCLPSQYAEEIDSWILFFIQIDTNI